VKSHVAATYSNSPQWRKSPVATNIVAASELAAT